MAPLITCLPGSDTFVASRSSISASNCLESAGHTAQLLWSCWPDTSELILAVTTF